MTILPDWHLSNLGSRILSLCQRRLNSDWQKVFGHPVVLLETFVDPQRFHGTVYKAANWLYVGNTKGFRRTRHGYTATAQLPKMVFVKPLLADARTLLCQAILQPPYCTGGSKIMLNAQQMQSLPSFFAEISDPRRAQGRRHRLSTVLAIVAGASLCGMRGYNAIADWAKSLGKNARQRFGCRFAKGRYIVPSEYIIRDVLIRVDPVQLDKALPSTARPCATPSMIKGIKPIFSASSAIRVRTATPKKSWHPARRKQRRSQTHQRDQDGHPAA